MKKIVFILLVFASNYGFSQTDVKCYPTHWWVGMKWNKLQIMVHGDHVADRFPMIKMGPGGITLATGVHLLKINRVENSNYIFS